MAATLTPRLEACYFAPDPAMDRFARRDPFDRMAAILEATAAEHCSGWERHIVRIDPTPRQSAIGKASHVQNVQKVEHWTEVVTAAPDGTPLLVIDADTAILRPLDDVWERSFDVAYTVKRRPFPYNLGVLFVRVSDRTRAWFAAWRDENLRMLEEREGVDAWRQTHGGINQASFARLRESGATTGLELLELPCREWNCEESGWPSFDPGRTRILHVKGELRRAMFQRFIVTPDTAKALAHYQALDRRVAAREARA